MLTIFKSQANIVAFNINFNILMEHKPIIFSDNQFSNLINLKIACQKIVVVVTYQLKVNRFRNIRKTPILEHFFDIFSAFRKFYNL